MKHISRLVKRLFLAPLFSVVAAIGDIDPDEVYRIVEKRVTRAENAVIRDYLAQHGIEGEEAEQAAEELRAKRREGMPSAEQMAQLKEKAERAESAARKARTDAQAQVCLARLGVPERNSADVLLLAAEGLARAEAENGNPELVREALEAVVARLPGLAAPTGETGKTAGSRGNFPRQEDAAVVLQQRLERARAAGDNAAAVGIITGAAAKGITLR